MIHEDSGRGQVISDVGTAGKGVTISEIAVIVVRAILTRS